MNTVTAVVECTYCSCTVYRATAEAAVVNAKSRREPQVLTRCVARAVIHTLFGSRGARGKPGWCGSNARVSARIGTRDDQLQIFRGVWIPCYGPHHSPCFTRQIRIPEPSASLGQHDLMAPTNRAALSYGYDVS